MSKSYTKNDIKVLDSIEKIRLNPGMFVGGTDEDAYYHLLREIYDNSFDEALAGHATKVKVTLDDDFKGATVIDDGRGIPYEKHEKTGFSTLATVFTIDGSGAKFESTAYSTSIGLHGVGSTATNALSELFEAKSFRNKKVAYVKFERGQFSKDTPDALITDNTSKLKHGTLIHFRPDPKIFGADLKYDPDVVATKLKETSYLLEGITIEFLRNKDAEPEVFRAKDGLIGLMKSKLLAEDKIAVPPFSSKLKFKSMVKKVEAEKDAEAEICFTWIDDAEDAQIYSFVNLCNTKDGGTHASGLEKGFDRALLAMAKNKCTTNELFRGLRACIHLKHPGPQFNTQTKHKLINTDLTNILADLVEKITSKCIRENKEWFDAFIKESISLYEQKMLDKDLKKAMKGLKKNKKGTKGVLPSKLYEADCSPSVRELFLCEGDSALGSCVDARDSSYQEVLALKGKPVNVLKSSLADSLANIEITNIITAIGGGVGVSFDLKKCRVAKVLLLADSDHDGKHISSLLLTFFMEYMKPFVEDGRLFLVDSPLFQAAVKGKDLRYYAHTMDQLKLKAGKDFGKCDITRLKGHGEANANAVAEYAMQPGTRKLIKVTLDMGSTTAIREIMSDDVTARKKLMGI